MDEREVIDITSDQSDYEEVDNERRIILEPVIRRVVHALGGYESGKGYQMGDEVAGCLKDLKKLWRKDDDDDDRTVARIFWETRVLPNDLVPILLATAGKGNVEDKRAIACADLMTAMTWPIDMAEELKELDEELDKRADFTQLLQSHLHYKAALLKPGVIQALFGIMIPPLAKPRKERTERDGQVVNVVLHLIRNLAFIKDLPFNSHLSSDQAELSSLQNKLIKTLEETKTFRLLLTIAANTDHDPLFNGWNTLVLEILFLLLRGSKPRTLTMDPEKQGKVDLHRLLAAEDKLRREISRNASSRHSRFGTTIAVKLNPKKAATNARSSDDSQPQSASQEGQASSSSRAFVLHRQQAINREAAEIMDMKKRSFAKKGNKVDEMAREDNLSTESRSILQRLATEFVQACFNPFLSALLKDIRSERARISEKDNLRLLFITKWFLEFFLSMREKAKATPDAGDNGKNANRWGFGLIAEVTERYWIVWVLKRMREAVEEKPKLWTELQAGIECLTQLLFLIGAMSSSGDLEDPGLRDAAEALRQQIIYNGEVLDAAVESLKTYKPGTQSLAYLDSSVNLSYALFRMLERWGKGDVYVRKKKASKKSKGPKGVGEEDGIPDVEEEVVEQEEIIHETMFTFEAFEMAGKFAHSEINHTLLTYLARYKEFTSSDDLRRVVSLLHRQAVKAKAEGLFFQVSTLHLFKTILADQKSFPRDQPHKDLVNLITFILRQFFKAVEKEPFLGVEVFFPMNRSNWKQYSSWEPEEKTKKIREKADQSEFPQEVVVKKGHSWSEELGIAIALLTKEGHAELVDWTTDILSMVIGQRQRIIEETDSQEKGELTDQDDEDEAQKANALHSKKPSNEAMSKMSDYDIPYLNDNQANAASQNPLLKLLFRLCKFAIHDEGMYQMMHNLNAVTECFPGVDELEWFVPAGIMPSDLHSTLVVINQFLETPFNLEGKKSAEFLAKKRRRRRRAPAPSDESDGSGDSDDGVTRKRKAKRTKEKEQYKSAQFIEDSDEEYGDMDAFLEKERVMRERAEKTATATGNSRPTNMKATGTKKRRRKGGETTASAKRQKSEPPSDHEVGEHDSPSDGSENEEDGLLQDEPPVKNRPRPRAIAKSQRADDASEIAGEEKATDEAHEPPSPLADRPVPVGRKHNRLVISDEEDD